MTERFTDLSDAWVSALDIRRGQIEPPTGVGVGHGTVVLQGASTFHSTPTALKLPLCLQTHTTAIPLSSTLIQVHCGK